MKRWIWMSIPALMLSAPAWSWCVDHDADDAKYCKEHPRPKCDGDRDDKHIAACKSGDTHGNKNGGTHARGVPEPGSLPLTILGAAALVPASFRRRNRRLHPRRGLRSRWREVPSLQSVAQGVVPWNEQH